MDTTLRGDQNQTKISQKLVVSDKFGVFAYYFSKLKLGTILNKSGITKTKGASPLELFTIVFNLAFLYEIECKFLRLFHTLCKYSAKN